MNEVFSPDLDVLFQERLSRIPVPPRPTQRPRSSHRRIAAAIAAAALTVAAMGTIFAANASAEVQGATCADLVTRLKLLTGAVQVVHEDSEVTHEASSHEVINHCEVHGTTITVSHR